jgi:phospholipid/cholesterol/gamma-HCH transport system substrate-binding protein
MSRPMPPGSSGGAAAAPPPPPADDTAPLTTRHVKHPGKSFSSRNPTPIGAIGLVILLGMLVAAFNAADLPLIGGGTQYHAVFTTSAQLKIGDDVRMAGVKIGKVDDVTLHNNSVKVDFTVKDAFIGAESTAAIKIKTVLGAKMLDIDSIGTKSMKAGATIGLNKTTTPFDVYPAFTQLTQTVQQIDTAKLAQSFEVLSSTFKNTPASVRVLVSGLSRLSDTIATRDQALTTLLQRAKDVTGVLVERDADLRVLLRDGGLLLDELTARREAIHSLLINTQTLGAQLRGLVSDNEKTIGPLLDQLDRIFALLLKNQENLDRGLALAGPFYRVFNNVIGNGRWFDNYIQNLNVTGVLSSLLGA